VKTLGAYGLRNAGKNGACVGTAEEERAGDGRRAERRD
jgi:hypothetical protein